MRSAKHAQRRERYNRIGPAAIGERSPNASIQVDQVTPDDHRAEHIESVRQVAATAGSANLQHRRVDLVKYRESPRDRERIASLVALLPQDIESALDVGARDGFISKLLADRLSA